MKTCSFISACGCLKKKISWSVFFPSNLKLLALSIHNFRRLRSEHPYMFQEFSTKVFVCTRTSHKQQPPYDATQGLPFGLSLLCSVKRPNIRDPASHLMASTTSSVGDLYLSIRTTTGACATRSVAAEDWPMATLIQIPAHRPTITGTASGVLTTFVWLVSTTHTRARAHAPDEEYM